MEQGAQARARKQKSRDNDVASDVLVEGKFAGPSQPRRVRQRRYAHSFVLEQIRQSVLRFTFFSQGHLAASVLLDPKFVDQMFLILIDCLSSRHELLEDEYNAKKAEFLSPDSELM